MAAIPREIDLGKHNPTGLSVTPTCRQSASSRFASGYCSINNLSDDVNGRLTQWQFPSEAARSNVRKLLAWRCNLTALTQSHDYYLAACGAEVVVYRPTFPRNGLSGKASLIVSLPISGPNLVGAIDPMKPHAVNYIMVDYLGNKEVFLVACDDGDVIGYYVDELHLQIMQSEEHHPYRPDRHNLRPFFHKNVGRSAWGLSIHTAARMIAVSSNTRRITVYWLELDGKNMTHRKEKKLELPDAGDNIPTVSFCNTPDDPDGEWLLSGSIGNWMMVWNTRTGVLYKKSQLSYCMNRKTDGTCSCGQAHTYPHAIWGTYWLDRRLFRKISPPSFSRALGLQRRGLTNKDFPTDFWDLSASRREVIEASEWYDGRANLAQIHSPPVASQEESDDEETELFLDVDSSEDDDDMDSDQMADSGSSSSPVAGSSASVSGAQYQNFPPSSHGTELADPMWDWFIPPRPLQRALDGCIPFLDTIPPSRAHVEQMLFPPELPILHISSKDVFVLQPQIAKASLRGPLFHNQHPSIDTISEFDHKNYYPVVGAHDPLYQVIKTAITPSFYSPIFKQTDRMNLHAIIPDLGVACIATGKGRVAVCTLTQMDVHSTGSAFKRPRDFNADTKLQSRYVGWEGTKTIYGFRMDYILPFTRQEQNCERPEHILVGIAAGPIPNSGWTRQPHHQPFELHGSGCKRWRLILTWMNHTILSYEISRRDQDQGVQVLCL